MKRIAVITMMTIFMGCGPDEIDYVYRDHMRNFVIGISEYAKSEVPGFIIIPQNGHELGFENEIEDSVPHFDYLEAIDGAGQEDLFYGYLRDDKATPEAESNYLLSLLHNMAGNDIAILVTDYCSEEEKQGDSYIRNKQHGFISFAAADRELRLIPSESVYAENEEGISKLSEAKNFLYLINNESYESKANYIAALDACNYDLFIIDLFFNDEPLASSDLSQLKTKPNGSDRLVICYMSIGEAEDYRYYWKSEWNDNSPYWLDEENSQWEGNYKVKYWKKDWQDIIYGTEDSYLDRIISAGFNGVYLDIIEAFEYFE